MAVTIGSYNAILSGAVGGSGSNDPLPSYTEIFTEGDWDDSVTPPSTDGIGDYESILSGGLGHSGGTLPDYTESTTRGHWAIIPAAIGLKVHYAVQIDISDLSTDTDATRGLYAGFFRWVTERPDYDGATVVPTGDNDGNVWGEGIMLSRAQLSPVDRIIDLNVSGDYGSLSGCNIAIDNATDYNADPASWADYFDQNNYELINRPVKIYAVIDDVFYQVWGGIVSEIKYDDQVMEFICSDIFEEVHKPIPREVITPQNFPLADSNSIGKTIPIVFGDVLRTELINVTGKSEPVTVGYANRTNTPVTITAATEYGISGSGRPYLLIKTNNNGFALDHFIDSGVHYLTVAKGESQSVLITGNVASVNDGDADSYTKIYLGKKLSVEPAVFNKTNAYTGTPISEDVWFFRIYKLNVTYLLSNNPIHSFPLTTLNDIILSRWNSDRLKYDPIPELIESFDNTASNEYGMPTMALLNSDIDIEGDFIRPIPIFPEEIELMSAVTAPEVVTQNDFGVEPDSILLDKDRSTSLQMYYASPDYMKKCIVRYRVKFPQDFVIEDLDELFICPDFDVEIKAGFGAKLKITITQEDQIEEGRFDPIINDYPESLIQNYTLNFLPDEYYRQGNDNNQSSVFGTYVNGTFISDIFKITNISNFKEALVSRNIYLEIHLQIVPGLIQGVIRRFTLKQIGFYGTQKINTQKSGLYVKTKGETVSGYETTNPRRVIQHIMETYDGIPPADIDLGNLESMATRDTWRVGRQIKEKKRSSEYLKELAGQTFTAIFPDRYGKRHAKTWLDDAANVWTHADDNGTILKNSIKKFEATPINEVFNEFTINYDWNPGLEQFNKTIFIRNVNAVGEPNPLAATFPAAGVSTGTDTPRAFSLVSIFRQSFIDDSVPWRARIAMASTSWAQIGMAVSFSGGEERTDFAFGTIEKIFTDDYIWVNFKNTMGAENVAVSTTGTLTSHSENITKWTSWVGGIADYYTAKGYWEMCYTSWLKTKTVNPLPEALGDCYWFPDPGAFDGYAGVDDSAAHKYLANLISWVTRQKYRTIYSIPISKNNAEIDLGDVLKFKDQKFTAGEYWTGYVEKIKINPGADTIEVEAILRPADLETFPPNVDLIIETGSAPDTITESGSQPNTITETGI